MSRNTVLKAGLLAIAVSLTSPALASDSINGNWITEEKDAIIKIGPCGKTICGRIARYLVTPPNGVDQKDIHNPNKKLRSRKLLGTAVLTGFKRDGEIWRGRIYDPKTGRSYRSEVSLDGSSKLKVKGCFTFICQGQSWTRAK